MGKAQIITNLGEGQYTVRPIYGGDVAARAASLLSQANDLTARIDAEQARADGYDSRIQSIDDQIAEHAAELAELTTSPDPGATWNPEAEEDDQVTFVQRAEIVRGLITEQMDERQPLARSRANHQRQADLLRLQQTALQSESARYQALADEHAAQESTAWCADYSDDLTGTVGTIELNGEPGGPSILAPQSRETGANLPSGILTQVTAMSPAQAALNFAIHPGWQRHKPMYRRGYLNSIDYDTDTATVVLFPLSDSHYQGLPINADTVFFNAPIEYMDCNAMVFEVGDEVVVEFRGQNWSDPVVAGFVEEPKNCITWCGDSTIYSLSVPLGAPVPPSHAHSDRFFASQPAIGLGVSMDESFLTGLGEFYNMRNILIDNDPDRKAYIQVVASNDYGTSGMPVLNDTEPLGDGHHAFQVNTCSQTVLTNTIKLQFGTVLCSHPITSSKFWIFAKKTKDHFYVRPHGGAFPDAPDGSLCGEISGSGFIYYHRTSGAWAIVDSSSDVVKSKICRILGPFSIENRPYVVGYAASFPLYSSHIVEEGFCTVYDGMSQNFGSSPYEKRNYLKYRKQTTSAYGSICQSSDINYVGYLERVYDPQNISSPCPDYFSECRVYGNSSNDFIWSIENTPTIFQYTSQYRFNVPCAYNSDYRPALGEEDIRKWSQPGELLVGNLPNLQFIAAGWQTTGSSYLTRPSRGIYHAKIV